MYALIFILFLLHYDNSALRVFDIFLWVLYFFVGISVHMIVVSFEVSPHLTGLLVDFPLGCCLRMVGFWACCGPEPKCIFGSSNRPLGFSSIWLLFEGWFRVVLLSC